MRAWTGTLLALPTLVAGCFVDVEAEIASGTYVLDADGNAGRVEVASLYGTTLEIDREAGRATLTLPDGTSEDRDLAFRDRGAWWEDCPTNFNATAVEVAGLGDGPLAVGDLSFEAPVIVADCDGTEGPADAVWLTDDPAGQGGFGVCVAGEGCLYLHL